MDDLESKVPPARRRGLRLDAFRVALGLTKKEFASRYLGVSDTNYSNWLSGRHNLPYEIIEKVRPHGIDANWIVHGLDRSLPADLRPKIVRAYRESVAGSAEHAASNRD